MQIHPIRWALAVVFAGCISSQPPPDDPVDRKGLTAEQCAAHGGIGIGDPGDGSTARPDYVCPSGKRPLGDYLPPKGGPYPIEGAVCCPR